MRRSSHRFPWLPLALALALAVPLALAAGALLRASSASDRFDLRHVPSSHAFSFLSRPVQVSLGDYYWLITVQYIGDQHLAKGRFDQLYALVDLVTDLDPGHGYAYQTGGIALSNPEHLEQSDAILKKGMERGPNWWSYPFYLAFNDYFYRGDYSSAARWAEIAARTPGASPNISKLALAMKVKSGSPDEAVRFIEEMRGLAHDEKTAAALDEQHRLALLARDFARLDAAVARFRNERGRDPSSLGDLVAAGLVDAVPRDPYGGTYVWRDGGVHSTTKDFRFTPPEPGRLRRVERHGAAAEGAR